MSPYSSSSLTTLIMPSLINGALKLINNLCELCASAVNFNYYQ